MAALLIESCSNGGIDKVLPWRLTSDHMLIQLGSSEGRGKIFPISAIQTKVLPDGEWLCGKFDPNAPPFPQDKAKGLSKSIVIFINAG